MMIYMAYVDELDVEFDPALHTDLSSNGLSGIFEQLEGEVATVTITRPQTGWAILSAAQKPYVLISESPTGDPEDAVLFARGRITGVPTDLFGRTQTITIECSPANLKDVADAGGTEDGPLINYARALPNDNNETCTLLDDAAENDPATYLIGRASAYHVDGATHEISLSDISSGPLINLSGAHFHDSQEVPQAIVDEMPVGRAKMVLRTSWTQSVQAICNIAGKLNFPYGISTLSPDFLSYADGDVATGYSDFIRGTGWELVPETSRVRVGTRRSAPIFSGRSFNTTYAPWITPSELEPFTILHTEMIRFRVWDYRADYVWLRGSYEQEREEEVELVLDMPIQAVPGVIAVTDEGEVSTIDLTLDASADPWEPGDYEVGDRVLYSGRVWECNEAHTSLHFFQYKPGGQRIYVDVPPRHNSVYTTAPNFFWNPVPSAAALRTDANEFFATDAGRGVIAHAMLRLRKALLQRARCITIQVKYAWADARHVTLKNSVRLETPLVPGGETSAIVGKVIGIRREWGNGGPTITLTLGVSLGTGADETTPEDLNGPYSEDYWPDNYLEEPSNLFGVAGDTEFVIDQDKLYRPILGDALRNPAYSVLSAEAENLADEQRSKAAFGALAGKDPRKIIQQNPTRVKVRMRDLVTEGVITRGHYVAGELLTSPRGIDLVTGGEP